MPTAKIPAVLLELGRVVPDPTNHPDRRGLWDWPVWQNKSGVVFSNAANPNPEGWDEEDWEEVKKYVRAYFELPDSQAKSSFAMRKKKKDGYERGRILWAEWGIHLWETVSGNATIERILSETGCHPEDIMAKNNINEFPAMRDHAVPAFLPFVLEVFGIEACILQDGEPQLGTAVQTLVKNLFQHVWSVLQKRARRREAAK